LFLPLVFRNAPRIRSSSSFTREHERPSTNTSFSLLLLNLFRPQKRQAPSLLLSPLYSGRWRAASFFLEVFLEPEDSSEVKLPRESEERRERREGEPSARKEVEKAEPKRLEEEDTFSSDETSSLRSMLRQRLGSMLRLSSILRREPSDLYSEVSREKMGMSERAAVAVRERIFSLWEGKKGGKDREGRRLRGV
jgi:hypothetical protein